METLCQRPPLRRATRATGRRDGRGACEGQESLGVAPPHHTEEDEKARDGPQREGQEQSDRPHERAQEHPDVGPHLA